MIKRTNTGKPWRLSRRDVLRGAGGVALGLPLLDAMQHPGRAVAQSVPGYTAAGYPKRFLVWYTPDGTIPGNWTPEGSGREFTFSPILAPLEPFREKLLLIDGPDQTGGSGGDAHQSGAQGALTGQRCNPGPFQGGDGFSAGWANGISVDQRVADVIGQETPFRSLELNVQTGGENNYGVISLRGPDRPVPGEQNPFAAYDRLFTDHTVDPGSSEVQLTNDRQRLVLDAVHENYVRLQQRLGAEDRQKLEQHAEALAEIEARLGRRPSAALDACAPPALGDALDFGRNENFPTVGRLQMDLMVMAMACDLTRVGTLMWAFGNNHTHHVWVDPAIVQGHHDMSHEPDTNEYAATTLTAINHWYATQLAYLLGRFDSIPEGDGTMLDNMVVVWINEMAKGNTHSLEDSHFVVAGGAGYFDMGRCLKFPYENGPKHNNLLLSLVHSMGIEDTSFGAEEWCTGPLDRMTG